jgi:hypothetical protein
MTEDDLQDIPYLTLRDPPPEVQSEMSLGPDFYSCVFRLVRPMPNRFQRFMWRVAFGVYWRKPE